VTSGGNDVIVRMEWTGEGKDKFVKKTADIQSNVY